MLQHVDTCDDVGRLFSFALRDVVAFDDGSGALLKVSRGRRRSGRPTRYYLVMPTKTFFEYDGREREAKAFGFTAWNDTEALRMANDKLPKWLAKGLVFNPKSYQWVRALAAPTPAQEEVQV